MAATYEARHLREDDAPPSRALSEAVFARVMRRDTRTRAASEEAKV